MRRALFAVAAILAGCGGGSSQEIVESCTAQLMPRVFSCIPAGYRGADASQLTPCLRGSANLLVELQQCRGEEPAAFADYLDHRVGHAARVMIESLTD